MKVKKKITVKTIAKKYLPETAKLFGPGNDYYHYLTMIETFDELMDGLRHLHEQEYFELLLGKKNKFVEEVENNFDFTKEINNNVNSLKTLTKINKTS